MKNRLFVPAVFQRRRERLLDALHRAGIDGVNRLHAQIIRQDLRLPLAARREIHVNAPAENALVARLDLAVPDKQQPRGGRLRNFFARGFLRHGFSALGNGQLLRGEQFLDAGLAEREQINQLRVGEGGFLAGALQFDEFARGIHDKV